MSSLVARHQQQHLSQQQCHLQQPAMAQGMCLGLQQRQARMGRNRPQLLWQGWAPLVAPWRHMVATACLAAPWHLLLQVPQVSRLPPRGRQFRACMGCILQPAQPAATQQATAIPLGQQPLLRGSRA
jgi:hypothetical protein